MQFLLLILTSFLSVNSNGFKVAVLRGKLPQYERVFRSFVESIDDSISVDEFVVEEKEINLNLSNYDLLFVIGAKSAVVGVKTLERQKLEIPVVFSVVFHPQRYFRKIKNVAGVSVFTPYEYTLAQVKMIVPSVERVAFIHKSLSDERITRIVDSGKTVGVEVLPLKVSKDDLLVKLKSQKSHFDAVWMFPDTKLWKKEEVNLFKKLTSWCVQNRKPLIVFSKNFVVAGGFVSVSINYDTIGSQSADLVHRILLGGEKAENIGIVDPIGTFIIVNKKVADSMGLQLSDELYEQVDEIVE